MVVCLCFSNMSVRLLSNLFVIVRCLTTSLGFYKMPPSFVVCYLSHLLQFVIVYINFLHMHCSSMFSSKKYGNKCESELNKKMNWIIDIYLSCFPSVLMRHPSFRLPPFLPHPCGGLPARCVPPPRPLTLNHPLSRGDPHPDSLEARRLHR